MYVCRMFCVLSSRAHIASTWWLLCSLSPTHQNIVIIFSNLFATNFFLLSFLCTRWHIWKLVWMYLRVSASAYGLQASVNARCIANCLCVRARVCWWYIGSQSWHVCLLCNLSVINHYKTNAFKLFAEHSQNTHDGAITVVAVLSLSLWMSLLLCMLLLRH